MLYEPATTYVAGFVVPARLYCQARPVRVPSVRSMDIIRAITSRASTRAFLDRTVSQDMVDAILDTARWAPSGVNTQPWQVMAVSGTTKQRLSDAILAARAAGVEPDPDYHYYPTQWDEPYKTRRFECGMALYGALDIRREDKQRRLEVWEANYRFFDAPVGLLFFIDRRMEKGSWVDMGMFIQNVMLAALAQGLATCPQASLAEYPATVRSTLELTDDLALICGMALGFPDPDAPVNQYRTSREPVSSFCRWYD